jgi:tetrahydromethanopterin S-methyltransferase subunit G
MTTDDPRRRRLGDCPLTPEQAYTLNTKLHSVCGEVQAIKKIVQEDHDILLKRTELWDRLEKMEQKIDIVVKDYERRKGAFVVLMSMAATIGAVLAVFVDKFFFR